MGLFSIFRKKTPQYSDRGKRMVGGKVLEGPAYLDRYTVVIDKQEELQAFEWKRKLKSLTGGNKFRIKYYGELCNDSSGLMMGTDFAPLLVLAEDVETGNEILLFDGCKYGYNAMFCDAYTLEQKQKRIANKYYIDKDGNEFFEILLSAYYQLSEDEFSDMIDQFGEVELLNGTKVSYEIARRNCFDVFQIFVINKAGKLIEILSEELA